jgi:WhiB family redox-sensing transcriptional regulator
MTKRPEIVRFASKNSLEVLTDFVDLPKWKGNEACLVVEDLDFFFSEFPLDIALAKDICAECPMIAACRAYAMKHENNGVWGGLSADERFELRGSKEAVETHEIAELIREKDFILLKSADVVAETYEVDTRTVARWRGTIRNAQKAS